MSTKFKVGDIVKWSKYSIRMASNSESDRYVVVMINDFRVYLKDYPKPGENDWAHCAALELATVEMNKKALKEAMGIK